MNNQDSRCRCGTDGEQVTTQNAFIASFNGRFRDECLNENWFLDLADARQIIEAWRLDYNSSRPHSALGYATPQEFAASHQGHCSGQRL